MWKWWGLEKWSLWFSNLSQEVISSPDNLHIGRVGVFGYWEYLKRGNKLIKDIICLSLILRVVLSIKSSLSDNCYIRRTWCQNLTLNLPFFIMERGCLCKPLGRGRRNGHTMHILLWKGLSNGPSVGNTHTQKRFLWNLIFFRVKILLKAHFV